MVRRNNKTADSAIHMIKYLTNNITQSCSVITKETETLLALHKLNKKSGRWKYQQYTAYLTRSQAKVLPPKNGQSLT